MEEKHHHHSDHHDHHTKHDHGGSEHHEHDHSEHHAHMIKDFRKRFYVCLALTVPVLILSPMIKNWLGLDFSIPGEPYILFGLSAILYFYGGRPFLKGLFDELKGGKPGMMTLIGVAISVAFVYSTAVVFGLEGKSFFWELATLIDVMLVGHWIEMRSVLNAQKSLKALNALIPDRAEVMIDGEFREVEVSKLHSGQKIRVKPGGSIPVDGKVLEGSSSVNESLLTGESDMVPKKAEDEVLGGSVNGNGALIIEVTKTGDDRYLSKVIRLVRDAQGKKSNTQRLADRAAFWLTIIALTMGVATLVVWLALDRELSFAMERAVTVMVICCPHALGLAIPLVSSISTSLAARNGLLIRDRNAFEQARKIDVVVFDKTGTLTTGKQSVREIHTLSDWSAERVLTNLAAIEFNSEHHIARAIAEKANNDKLSVPSASEFNYTPGLGVQAKVEDVVYYAGGLPLLEKLSLSVEHGMEEIDGTIVFLATKDKVLGYLTLSDEIRKDSLEAIQSIQAMDIRCLLLTGDRKEVAARVSETLGMDDYTAEVMPEAKLDYVERLQNQGSFVAMTGDGINDAPALAQADIGIAIGGGTDVAAETSDIILVNSNPRDIVRLIDFGRSTHRKMIQNLVWATGYNAIALPLATGFVAGWTISPAIGAAFMSISTVVCAVNAQLLRYSLKD